MPNIGDAYLKKEIKNRNKYSPSGIFNHKHHQKKNYSSFGLFAPMSYNTTKNKLRTKSVIDIRRKKFNSKNKNKYSHIEMFPIIKNYFREKS